MTWILLTTYWLGEKLKDSIRATRVREGCLLWEFRAAIGVNLIKIPYWLTAKTIHIHIFYFPTISLFFGAKWKKNWLYSWLTPIGLRLEVDFGSPLARVTLQLIISRFLRYKDCEQIHLLGHRLKNTGYKTFQDMSYGIVERRRKQMDTEKTAKRNKIPASFSKSPPDKLYNRGKPWPSSKPLDVFSN